MANQEVPRDLMELAMQAQWFKNSRYKKGKGKGAGGTGLGFRDRPALGYEGDTSNSKVKQIEFILSKLQSFWKVPHIHTSKSAIPNSTDAKMAMANSQRYS